MNIYTFISMLLVVLVSSCSVGKHDPANRTLTQYYVDELEYLDQVAILNINLADQYASDSGSLVKANELFNASVRNGEDALSIKLFLYSIFLAKQGEYKQAVPLIERALIKTEGNIEMTIFYIVCLRGNGQYEDADKMVQRLDLQSYDKYLDVLSLALRGEAEVGILMVHSGLSSRQVEFVDLIQNLSRIQGGRTLISSF